MRSYMTRNLSQNVSRFMSDTRIPWSMLQPVLLYIEVFLIGQLLGPISGLLRILPDGLAIVFAVSLVLAHIAVAKPNVVVHIRNVFGVILPFVMLRELLLHVDIRLRVWRVW
jgi:hypothetical protein